jgi:DNA-binding response OmpR family regulator
MNKKDFSKQRIENKLREEVRNALAQNKLLNNKDINLFIVDDDQMFSKYLKASLLREFRNIKVRIFSSGKDAINVFINAPPDLVILDINMPELNGHKVALIMNCIQETGIPILFISANNRSRDELKYLEIKSSFDFLPKPVDKNLLKLKVEELLVKAA